MLENEKLSMDAPRKTLPTNELYYLSLSFTDITPERAQRLINAVSAIAAPEMQNYTVHFTANSEIEED